MQKLTQQKSHTLLDHAKFMKFNNPKMRLGQCVSKLLELQYPTIYKEIRSTEYDPFYSDDLINKCLIEITN